MFSTEGGRSALVPRCCLDTTDTDDTTFQPIVRMTSSLNVAGQLFGRFAPSTAWTTRTSGWKTGMRYVKLSYQRDFRGGKVSTRSIFHGRVEMAVSHTKTWTGR